ncbi:hypothetical protein EYF80_046108 [Liparis tanakae]|uniref:Uncharacterized protein n=1 Tax=Liparis tanakae TaxID=230148 RepID=A0A4Z2FRS0_9TELE|nr:hypothetical protein EYF80_046108 [Liparis tanakae]
MCIIGCMQLSLIITIIITIITIIITIITIIITIIIIIIRDPETVSCHPLLVQRTTDEYRRKGVSTRPFPSGS